MLHRVLLVHNRYRTPGGEERVVENQKQWLVKHGHVVELYEVDSRGVVSASRWRRVQSGFEVPFSWTHYRRLQAVALRFKPDIIHIHNVFPFITPSAHWALRQFAPIIQTLHNYRFLCINGLFLDPQHRVCERCKTGAHWQGLMRGCYQDSRLRSLPLTAALYLHRQLRTLDRCVDQFIAPSAFLRQKFIEGALPSDRIHVLSNPVPTPPVVRELSQSPLFVYAGRLSSEKGVWTLIKAFGMQQDVRLVILGDGPLREVLEREIRMQRWGHIEMPGMADKADVMDWMRRAWALVMPSECYENLPQAVLEAWACGTPVIAADIGGLGEMIRAGGPGWLFSSGDPQALRECVQRLVHSSQDLRELTDTCRAHVQQMFSEETIYGRLLTLYEQLRSRAIVCV